MGLFYHLFDVQVLYGDVLIVINDFFRCFVTKIVSLVADFFMSLRYDFALLDTLFRAFFRLSQCPLGFGKGFLPFLKKPRIRNFFPIG